MKMRNGKGNIDGWRRVIRGSIVRNKIREGVDHIRLTDGDKRS